MEKRIAQNSLALLLLLLSMAGCTLQKQPSVSSTPATPSEKVVLDADGFFVYEGGTAAPVHISIPGAIEDTENSVDTLDISLDLPEEFRYRIGSSTPAYTSTNQKNSHLPHLLVSMHFAYDKTLNSAVPMYFALDLNTESCIILFQSQPDCYFVASADSSKDHNELIEHFSDFIESYSPLIWMEETT